MRMLLILSLGILLAGCAPDSQSGSGGEADGELTVEMHRLGGTPADLRIDGVRVYTFTGYIPASGAQVCGANSEAAFTATLTAGTHSIEAEKQDSTLGWGPHQVNVVAGECGFFLLR